MYLNIGGDTLVKKNEIMAIMDIENTSVSKKTREFVTAAERGGRVKYVSDVMPKSFILTNENGKIFVYISPLLSSTLYKRYQAWL